MKSITTLIVVGLLSTSALAQYKTFFKNVNWDISKSEIESSRSVETSKNINIDGAQVLRLHFDKRTRLGKGNALKIEFPHKQKSLYITDKILRGFNYGTPYLKGGKFRLKVLTKNRAAFKGIRIVKIEAVRPYRARRSRSICENDDRIASKEKKMGRMMRDTNGSGGCSGGMFSKTCLITAGHCMSTTNIVEFQVPKSTNSGSPVPAKPEDQYPRGEVIASNNGGMGKDWAVIRYKANPITNKFPGDAQGSYKTNANVLKKGAVIRITGYGTDSEKEKSQTQQTNTGELIHFQAALGYHVDTTPGNSGTPVVDEATNSIIGVHTHGGCTVNGGYNTGTSLHFVPEFKEAVKKCLALERAELARLKRN